MAAIRIVIADDEPTLRLLMRVTFEVEGDLEVVGEAADGVEAVRVVGSLQPDVLVLDLSMPRMSGLDALPQIRSVAPGTRVIVFSANERTVVEEQVLELGATAFVSKGDDLGELLDAIRRAGVIRRDRRASMPAPTASVRV